jgi:hypothetical protein
MIQRTTMPPRRGAPGGLDGMKIQSSALFGLRPLSMKLGHVDNDASRRYNQGEGVKASLPMSHAITRRDTIKVAP